MKAHTEDSATIDDLDLAIEMLKDLTPTARQADAVRGGKCVPGNTCECGTA
jgi:hypothetical protein